ncbi:hypothetical protein ACA910_009889 [Epithemia clementina (nom. ined.)]
MVSSFASHCSEVQITESESFEVIMTDPDEEKKEDDNNNHKNNNTAFKNIWRNKKGESSKSGTPLRMIRSGSAKDGDEEQGDQTSNSASLVTADIGIPAFRCAVFNPSRHINKINANPSNATLDTANDETWSQQGGGLGLALLIQDENTENEFWVVDNIKVKSPLVDSPIERGDILVKVNGKTKLKEALDEIQENPDRRISIVVFNPNPKAEFDLVETWIHPSAFETQGEGPQGATLEDDMMGLVLNSLETDDGYLAVAHNGTGFWEHALLDERDTIVALHRVSAQNVSQPKIEKVLKDDRAKNRTITIHTRIRSQDGKVLATTMKNQSGDYLARSGYHGQTYARMRLGIFAGIVVLALFIILILVIIDASRHKDEDLSNRGMDFCEGEDCAIEGRPYRDVRGYDISATTQICSNQNQDELLWSTIRTSEENSLDFFQQDGGTPDHADIEEHNAWLGRALGEHASIASFAAFTIALMTNQAPPDLIHDALQAAMDEWNHAAISFAWANQMSENGGIFHEPSALPPTQHSFQADLNALAISTGLEGCIGETLSAMDLAIQVDTKYSKTGRMTPMTASIEKIALEEAQHSALAWRTIRWVCATDDEACEAVQKAALNEASMDSMFEKRFPTATEQQKQLWRGMRQNLLPFAKGETTEDACVQLSNAKIDATLKDSTVARAVAEKIVELCLCRTPYQTRPKTVDTSFA